jgi:hypothetical protein
MAIKIVASAMAILPLLFADDSPVRKPLNAGGKWIYTIIEDKLTGAQFGVFGLPAIEPIGDGISSGTPVLIITCGGTAKSPHWVDSKFISLVVLGVSDGTSPLGVPHQLIVLRAGSKIHPHFWNMHGDFHTLFVDKGATKEFLDSQDARIQFRDASEHQQVAVFSPAGINRQMLNTACGKALR